MSKQTGAAIGAIATTVNWDRKGLDLQAIIQAANQGKLGEPLTDWLLKKGWEKQMVEVVQSKVKPTPASDPIIRLDRSTELVFPRWVKQVMHPELQDVGPSKFDITQVERWLHNDQGSDFVSGQMIYDYHKENNMLMADFGLRELLAIKAKGTKFFREHFNGKYPCAWKSVVLRGKGRLYVPYLGQYGAEVALYWYWIDNALDFRNPALRHASPKI